MGRAGVGGSGWNLRRAKNRPTNGACAENDLSVGEDLSAMKITVLGAGGGEVTGSSYLVETRQARVLVDFGLYQGGRVAEELNRTSAGVPRSGLDAVILTHGHLDHTGRLPLLAQYGYAGPIYSTAATVEMAALILRDSAKLHAQEAERVNRKRQRSGEEAVEPLYTVEQAEAVIGQMSAVEYQRPVPVAPGVKAIWAEAGHMLGSASIQMEIAEGSETRRVVFSGDLGPKGAPILRDFEPFQRADAVFLESTYGDRDHRPFGETVEEFVEVVQAAVREKGKILVPTFAVGRAQLLCVLLGWMFRTGKVKPFPVFLDSPMAIEASRIYQRHPELFDDEMMAFLKERPLSEDLKTLKATVTAQESKAINDVSGPCLVLAGSGMCNAGRILHHLKHGLWQRGTRVLIVGFQSRGSLGRRLVDGDTLVSIHGEPIAVRATVHSLGGFSAHAGQTDLLSWFGSVAGSRPRVVLTHGENPQRAALAGKLKERHGLVALRPSLGESIEL